MATYTGYSQGWLEDTTTIKIVLVVAQVYNVTGVSTDTLYFSNAPYATSDGVVFSPVIRRNVTLSETLNPEGSGAMTFGDIEFDNQNGELDSYLDSTKYIWSNQTIKIHYGDPQFVCATVGDLDTKFSLIFNGIIDDVDSRTRSALNLKVRDKLERLNTPLTETKLGTYGTWSGGQTNQDTTIPIVFGEVFNITPLLIDPSLLEYQANLGGIGGIIEVRDNGYPIYNDSKTASVTVDTATGKFKLTKAPAGTITCSIQGLNESVQFTNSTTAVTTTYRNDIAGIIAEIVTKYGKSNTRLTTSDIDKSNFYSFQTANTAAVGIMISDSSTVISVCRQLAASLGCQLFFTRSGLLQLLQYGVGFTNSALTTIDENDIIYNTFQISNRPGVVGAVKLGYAKNYTVQSQLMTNIAAANKETLGDEWLTVTKTNSTVITNYKLSSDVQQSDTCLITTAAANTEAQRRLDLYSAQKTVYRFTGINRLLGLQLGQNVTLTHSRFGLSGGKTAQVISLNPNWTMGTVEVEVLV